MELHERVHPNGVHHMAITTANMKEQVTFFCDVLGCELKALYWMHGAEATFHGFLKLNEYSYVAFVQPPAGAVADPVYGVSHTGGAARSTAGGVLQHVAFNVDTIDDLLALRDRIRSRGYNVFGPIDHGFCRSMYFSGPENLSLEIATSEVGIEVEKWIDPEVAELAGFTAEELQEVTRSTPFVRPATPVPQPPRDGFPAYAGMPEDRYAAIIALSDEECSELMSEPTPPVQDPVSV